MNKVMTISRVARAAGVNVETVRYYHRRGLLRLPAAGTNSYRAYDASQLRRLIMIRRLQTAGFTLAEIHELIDLDRTDDRLRVQEIAASKVKDLKSRIRELRQVVKSLEALVEHCHHAEAGTPCPIIESFESEVEVDAGRRPR